VTEAAAEIAEIECGDRFGALRRNATTQRDE